MVRIRPVEAVGRREADILLEAAAPEARQVGRSPAALQAVADLWVGRRRVPADLPAVMSAAAGSLMRTSKLTMAWMPSRVYIWNPGMTPRLSWERRPSPTCAAHVELAAAEET